MQDGMSILDEVAPVTIPGWCFQPCRVALGVNEALCEACEKAVVLDIRKGMRSRRYPRRRAA
jgi:hypothetical protein